MEEVKKEIIEEKDTITTIVKKEPADSKPTGTKVIQTKEYITLQMQ